MSMLPELNTRWRESIYIDQDECKKGYIEFAIMADSELIYLFNNAGGSWIKMESAINSDLILKFENPNDTTDNVTGLVIPDFTDVIKRYVTLKFKPDTLHSYLPCPEIDNYIYKLTQKILKEIEENDQK